MPASTTCDIAIILVRALFSLWLRSILHCNQPARHPLMTSKTSCCLPFIRSHVIQPPHPSNSSSLSPPHNTSISRSPSPARTLERFALHGPNVHTLLCLLVGALLEGGPEPALHLLLPRPCRPLQLCGRFQKIVAFRPRCRDSCKFLQ